MKTVTSAHIQIITRRVFVQIVWRECVYHVTIIYSHFKAAQFDKLHRKVLFVAKESELNGKKMYRGSCIPIDTFPRARSCCYCYAYENGFQYIEQVFLVTSQCRNTCYDFILIGREMHELDMFPS